MRVTQSTPTSATLVAFDSYWNGHTFVDSVEITASRKLRDQWLDLGVGRAESPRFPPSRFDAPSRNIFVW